MGLEYCFCWACQFECHGLWYKIWGNYSRKWHGYNLSSRVSHNYLTNCYGFYLISTICDYSRKWHGYNLSSTVCHSYFRNFVGSIWDLKVVIITLVKGMGSVWFPRSIIIIPVIVVGSIWDLQCVISILVNDVGSNSIQCLRYFLFS